MEHNANHNNRDDQFHAERQRSCRQDQLALGAHPESLAPVLPGRDPSEIDRLWADMSLAVSSYGWVGQTALANRGEYITQAEFQHCLEPVQKIRDAVGDRIEIGMEFHGYWNLPSAVKSARALEGYKIL